MVKLVMKWSIPQVSDKVIFISFLFFICKKCATLSKRSWAFHRNSMLKKTSLFCHDYVGCFEVKKKSENLLKMLEYDSNVIEWGSLNFHKKRISFPWDCIAAIVVQNAHLTLFRIEHKRRNYMKITSILFWIIFNLE